ncbi:hypothetical protein [Haloprofundus sp. MHR1]|uniref:hypothetical protein n=1 Tax=Haloprofundus sp. MHR1 TaxID=2572921 RepID=UPI0010BE8E0C|nr:hypothetical protein [Haloprofundus sp. MHR1]QCJ47242.1 hypothetical protein FCF25_08990 [Haloprofundus sp. MHR1]
MGSETTARETLVHLSGYSSIAVVLATADWASLVAVIFVAPLLLGTLAYGGYLGAQKLIELARREVDREETALATESVTTDGGREIKQ